LSDDTKSLGHIGEDIACYYLERHGYKILVRNYRRRFGEIDIIARDGKSLVFIEVKTRSNNRFGNPLEAVDTRKQGQIAKVALDYLARNKLLDKPARFDIVTIFYKKEQIPDVEIIKNGFEIQV